MTLLLQNVAGATLPAAGHTQVMPMTFSLETPVQTRDGRKVRLESVLHDEERYPLVGQVEIWSAGPGLRKMVQCSWARNGSWHHGHVTRLDLVPLGSEPDTREDAPDDLNGPAKDCPLSRRDRRRSPS